MVKGCLQMIFNLLVLCWLFILTVIVFMGGPAKTIKNIAIPSEVLESAEAMLDNLYKGKGFTPEMRELIEDVQEKLEDKQNMLLDEMHTEK